MAETVRILADDLTGALDAAAPFAAARGPLPVLWPPASAPDDGSFAYDSETRNGGPLPEGVLEALPGGLAFKKVDSLFRGATAAELVACARSGRFASIVIAPAFPAQNRITRNGRQLWRASEHDEWRPVDLDLLAALRDAGLEVRCVATADRVTGEGIFLADATSEHDLHAIAAAGSRLAPPTLWVGSAGLARAFSGDPAPGHADRRAGLVIVGSHHPVTLAQVQALEAAGAVRIVRLNPGDPPTPAVDAVTRLVQDGQTVLLHFALPDGTGAAVAGPLFERSFQLLALRLAPPPWIAVTGGSTLHRLVRVLRADALEVLGEWAPGIPVSRICGSVWDGTGVISKSGGFGPPGTFVAMTGGSRPEEGS